MDSDSWTTSRLSAAAATSRRYLSRSDLYREGDGIDHSDDESRPEFLCPFCAEVFDVVGLCCHIDADHAVEAKNGVCPVCAKRLGMDLVGHITMQHGSLLKISFLFESVDGLQNTGSMSRKRRFRKGGSNLTFSILRKELREGNLQSRLGELQYSVSSSNTEPDPLLSSFMYNLPMVDEPVRVKSHSSAEAISMKGSSSDHSSERNIQLSPLSDKDQQERTNKCQFVQGLLLSTFLDDNL